MALSKIELETLLLLAEQGSLSGYDLHSKVKDDGSGEKADTNIMSDVYWLQVRKKLLEWKLIEEISEEGRRKPYRLSEDGFDYLIQNHLAEIHDFDAFAENCREYFPLVFDYWAELKDLKLVDYFISRLTPSIDEVYVDVFRDLALGKRTRFSHREFIGELYIQLYAPELSLDDAEKKIEQFGDIRKFRESHKEIQETIEQWKEEKKKKLENEIKKLDSV